MEAGLSGQAGSSSRDGHQLVVDDLRQFQTIVEAIASGIVIFQGETMRYVNPYTESITGYSKDELMAMSFWSIVHPDYLEMVQQRGHARQAGDDVPEHYDFKIVRKDGEVRWVNWRASVITLSGKPAVMGVVEDITKRKHAEQALYESEKKYRGMVMGLKEGFYRVTLDGKLQDYNVEFTKIFSLDPSKDYTGIALPDFWQNPEDRKNYTREIKTHGFIRNYAVQARKVDGEKVVVLVNARLIKDDDGNPPLIEGSFLDVTERKQAESLIKRTAAILEMIATGQPVAGIYDAIARMYEKRHPGMRCSLLVLKGNQLMHGGSPSLPSEYCNAINGLKNGPDVGSCGTSSYTGKRVLVEDIATDPKWADLKNVALPYGLRCCWSEPIKSVSGEVLGAFGMYYNHPALPDEQELSDLESAARLAGIVMERERRSESLRKLSQAIEQAGESVVITDKNGVIEYVNPRFTTLTGYSSEEAIGQTPRLLKSGNQDDVFYEKMWKTISKGEIWHGKIIDRKKDGSFYPAMLTISPVHTQGGDAVSHTHYVGIQSDLSQIEDLEQQFHQAQKMEAIGTLVGGIAHDFNNMLAGMTGNLYLAKKRIQGMPEVMQKLTNVEEISMRAANMIEQLLTFARKDRVSIKPVPFTPFIKETLKLLRASVPENIAIHEEVCADALQVMGDSTLLHQVLMNLITNARDALEGVEHPCINVGLERFQADESFVKARAYFKAGAYAHLSVQDNGCGIPKKQIKHLFEPFFTTKEQGKGTGLGLAMVFGAVKTHHGFVEVDSKRGEGSVFHIYLPLLEHKTGLSESERHTDITEPGHGEMILFADDQQQVLTTGKEVLESLGYQVLTATNGQQAVDVFEAHAAEIDLCILDIIMPVMDGSRAAEHMRQIRPEIPIVFSTGYDKLSRANMADETVISKPFPIASLSRLIRNKIDG